MAEMDMDQVGSSGFVAMLGFTTPGHPVRYAVLPTALSAVLAASAVFAGLVLFGMRRTFAWWRSA